MNKHVIKIVLSIKFQKKSLIIQQTVVHEFICPLRLCCSLSFGTENVTRTVEM